MSKVLLSLGSNLGNSEEILIKAIADISHLPNVEILTVASMYQTKPQGYLEQDDFINTACMLETNLEPLLLLENLLKLEQKYKRVRLFKNGPRTLDIDMIAYDDFISDNQRLILPHPRMHERAFVLAPLAEICPDFYITKLKKTILELFRDLNEEQKQGVKKLNG